MSKNCAHTDPILSKIERFMKRRDMSAVAFGKAAAKDPNLVYQLRKGREPRRALRNRVEAFLEKQASASEGASA